MGAALAFRWSGPKYTLAISHWIGEHFHDLAMVRGESDGTGAPSGFQRVAILEDGAEAAYGPRLHGVGHTPARLRAAAPGYGCDAAWRFEAAAPRRW
jgi:hypothetical protein